MKRLGLMKKSHAFEGQLVLEEKARQMMVKCRAKKIKMLTILDEEISFLLEEHLQYSLSDLL